MKINYEYDIHGNKHFKNEVSGTKGTLWHLDKEDINPIIISHIKKFEDQIIESLENRTPGPVIFYIRGILKEEFGKKTVSGFSYFTIQVDLKKISENNEETTLSFHSYPDKWDNSKKEFEKSCC